MDNKSDSTLEGAGYNSRTTSDKDSSCSDGVKVRNYLNNSYRKRLDRSDSVMSVSSNNTTLIERPDSHIFSDNHSSGSYVNILAKKRTSNNSIKKYKETIDGYSADDEEGKGVPIDRTKGKNLPKKQEEKKDNFFSEKIQRERSYKRFDMLVKHA